MTFPPAFHRLLIALVLLGAPAGASEYSLIPHDPVPEPFAAGPIPRSAAIVDDATLYDIAAVGDHCWAVGERSVVLRSHDAGNTWTSGTLPFDCSLTSVCFLTNRIGFVAGLRLDLHSNADRGVLLTTHDGGLTWKDVSPKGTLRGLRFVQFFGLERGVVLTTANPGHGGRLLVTEDSGRTWSEIKSKTDPADWSSATFLNQDEGLIVGSGQAYGLLNSNNLIMRGFPRKTLQTVNAASLSSDGRAWLVGDGGFIRRSTDRGLNWKLPPGRFPTEIRDIFQLTSVVHDGERVCVAGTPASSVLYSADAGATWSTVPCAGGGAIHRLVRTGTHSILAVGSWGMIMRSDDFGASWKNVRHGQRRSALMYIVTDPQDAAASMLAQVAGEQGYRVSVLQPSRQLERPSTHDRWRMALSGLGVNTFSTDWRFARSRHQHGMSRPALLQAWDAASDGRLRELVPLRMATQIRTWRPDVICIEASGDNDGVASVWQSVMETANRIAAGSDERAAPLDNAGLPPWSAGRIIRRVDRENTPLKFRPDDLLPRLRTTSGLAAATWNLSVSPDSQLRNDDAAYRVHGNTTAATPRNMFQDISVPPGTDGRRELPAFNGGIEDLQKIIARHHTQKLAVAGQVDRDPLGESLIAYTQTIGNNLPAAMAAAQLQHMLDLFRRRENLEGRISVLKEFTRRLPNSPQAAQAAEELHLLYSSAEILSLRKADRPEKAATGQNSVVRIPNGSRPAGTVKMIPGLPAPAYTSEPWILPAAGTSLDRLHTSRGSGDDALDQHWGQQADRSWDIIQQLAPVSAATARQQLILAARYRRLQQFGRERTTLARASHAADSHRLLAANEMQAGFDAVEPVLQAYNLPESRQRPELDGVLSDLCWQQAPEIRLKDGRPGDGIADSLVMMSWDAEFLFLSGHVPTAADKAPADEALNRTHDEADITTDHVEFQLDVDRDYSTAWHFVIDSAGRTSDRCWQFTRWNPEWYVATQRDPTGWRFEAAIPVHELRPMPLKAGAKWAVSVRRIVPGYADQRVDVSEAAKELETRYSLIRFIRNRRPK
ncbi:MAG: hypothetical protein ABGZ35_30875 [Planctomycetaceae bacterium]